MNLLEEHIGRSRRKECMFKRLAIVTMAATMLAATPAYAGQWMQDSTGWWWQNDDGSYPYLACAWIDGNHDGVAENYCFDERGYLNMNPVDEGLTVDENGALIYNGAVCTAVLPDGRDYEMGMAIDGKRVNWVYHETEDSILRRQEAEEKAAADKAEREKIDLEQNTATVEDANAYVDIDTDEIARQVVDLVNQERESRGKAALECNDELMDNAALRAEEISEQFTHSRPDGSSCNTVVSIKNFGVGENIEATGSIDVAKSDIEDLAKHLVKQWMASPGHKKNILDSRYKETGVGIYVYDNNIYASQLFIIK